MRVFLRYKSIIRFFSRYNQLKVKFKFLVEQETFIPIGNWSQSIPKDILINKLLDPALNIVRTQRNIDAIKWVAAQTNSKLLILEHVVEDVDSRQFDNVKARDGIHGGAKWHKHILHQFKNKLKEDIC